MASAIPNDAGAFLRELISRLQRGTLARLKSIPAEALYWQPHRESNSIGVTIWHFSRWWDLFGTVTLVGGNIEDQHWLRDGWMKRTGYDPRGIGDPKYGLITGYTVDEMLAVPHLNAEDLAAYHTASTDSALAALAHDDTASLAAMMRFGEGQAEGSRYAQVLGLALGSHRHLGEIDALASLRERQGRT